MGTRSSASAKKRRSGSQNKSVNGSARADLLRVAKKLFARKGLSGTSIRDIAQAANINSSMISYYFDGKDGLYRECLQEIAETRLHFANEILSEPQSAEEFRVRLSMFVDNLMQAFIDDRDIGLIIIREYDRVNSPAEKVFKQNFLRLIDAILEFFKQGQRLGFVPEDRDPYILASLFFGSITSQLRLDHIKSKAYDRSLRDPKERERIKQHIVALYGPVSK